VRRSYILCIAGACAVSLIAASPQRLVGDGREYLAQALNFASLHGPPLRPRDLGEIQLEMARFDPTLASWNIRDATVADSRRNLDFQHFWFYALLAAPGVWLTRLLDLPPTLAFTGLNLVFIGLALWTAIPRIGSAASVLLFASPIIWWIDKAHTEVFTFSLLVVAFALIEERPWWSMIAAGAAATQNPPIAAVLLFIWLAAVSRARSAVVDRRVATGALLGLALALLHPIYTFVHHQSPSLLLSATRRGLPSLASVTAVITDPAIGLIGNFPVFLIVVLAALAWRGPAANAATAPPAAWRRRNAAVAAGAAVVFFISFARTTNVHHGGTPGMSRYAIWLIPLAVPLLAGMQEVRNHGWRRFLWAAAIASATISVAAFRPSVPQNSREPTALASFLWTRLPSLNNPLPEVFSETELHLDDLWVPAATAGCEKVLLGVTPDAGAWPIPCYPAPVPEMCQPAGTLCYANRTKNGYRFAHAPGEAAGKLRSDAVWPVDAAPHVRRIYEAWDWPTLDFDTTKPGPVQEAAGVSAVALGSADRFVVVLRDVRPAAVLRLQPARQRRGVLVDALTGRTVADEECAENRACTIPLPEGFTILLLAMR